MKTNNSLPKLSPLQSDWMLQLIGNKGLIDKLFETYGSPINIHHLPNFDKNVSLFQEVFKRHHIPFKLFYARKANKSKSLVKRAEQNGIGVDTASFRELQQALEAGVNPKRLVVTAAIKSKKLLKLAVENEVLVILDNQDECDLLSSIAKKLNKQTPVGFRVSGFLVGSKKLYSRFGFDIDKVEFIISSNCKPKNKTHLNYTGLHFHLNAYSTQERGAALCQCLLLSEELKAKGFHTEFIDIGGGVLMNYLSDKTEWINFKEELKKAVKGEREELTFNNDGLGYQMIENKLEGDLATYPFYNENNSAIFIEKILNYQNLSELLQDKAIEIRMELGRSLLDQVGLTLARVVFRKKDMYGRWLVGLEMNMSQLQSSSADFLLDPIYAFEIAEEDPVDAYFTGAYCLERDIVLKRKITLPHLPKVNDVIGFVNTAGYMMHFFETQAHLFELSVNLSLEEKKEHYEFKDFKNEE
ncbi:type III PLP-dependent enzyme domain-containing protein [Psychroflexus montanilacus]|uniref:Y4yA family PLP-dependent enzyme n=1 Tax=Psychroflexus montanilacus TaxID=2873598 RepID=UPI001CCE08BE|nr:Y4yA family PLP-dependent enzyme [Psychroflexus montanilacus]MBZ9650919.1 Y4yA family PLP-dependent enzyme [Psychroflexus montanilacus]